MTKKLTNIAKRLRRDSTNAERLLWSRLKSKRLDGYKFRRQQPIADYVVDFVCLEMGVVIEVAGGQHSEENHENKDIQRDVLLREEGFTVLRYWNNEVLGNIEGVLETIREVLSGHPPPTPPLKGGVKK